MAGTTSTYAIETSGLRKSFGDVEALSGVDLQVEPGTVLGVVGANGAGKTTLLKILARVIGPTTGHVRGHGRVV